MEGGHEGQSANATPDDCCSATCPTETERIGAIHVASFSIAARSALSAAFSRQSERQPIAHKLHGENPWRHHIHGLPLDNLARSQRMPSALVRFPPHSRP